MSFLDGKRRIASETCVIAPWSGAKNGKYFRCAFCGYKFKIGDGWRCIYTNDMPGASGNPLCCDGCFTDKDATRQRWIVINEKFQKLKEEFWWFFKNTEDFFP